jgi:hypothetical protein
VPQISKVRIVNFYYNEGNRLIADELYDFHDNNKKNANNVLINLANGGGKSVIIQLMMQPIKPRATAAGRKIESFFIKPGYHSYILLEWRKDKSSERLLTGISIRALINSDNERGKRIQYYTFMSEYINDYDPESIISLELSSNSNGNFVPADYEYIKKLSKNSNRINCYSQDRNKEWKDKLKEFNIYPNEWEMIEKINAAEGGLDPFFNQYETSDDLIDDFLIPAIENEIRGESFDHPSEDSSLTTMFLNYADKHMKSADLIKKQEVFNKYVEQLTPFLSKIESLYDAEDKSRISVRKMFGFADALVIKKEEQDDLKKQIEEKEENYKAELERIDYEEVSAEYYSCNNDLDNSLKLKDEAQNEVNRLQEEKAGLVEKIKIQECADYLTKQRKAESEAEGIRKAIEKLESESDIAELISSLKYSVYTKAKNDIELLSGKKKKYDRELSEHKINAEDISNAIKRIEQEKKELEIKQSSLNENLDYIKGQTDSIVLENNFDLTRSILGSYEISDVNLLEQTLLKEKDDLDKKKKDEEENKKQLEDERENVSNEIISVNQIISDHKRHLDELYKEIEEYDSKYGELCVICNYYDLKENVIFNGGLYTEVKQRLAEKETIIEKCRNDIKVQQRLLNAAHNSCVHVSNEVIEYLSALKVEYNTCEKYLLKQIENGIIKEDGVRDLLKQYPFLAYSLIIEDREYEKIKYADDDIWFEAAIPVFNMKEIGEMLNESKECCKYIAAYSKSLFENREDFISDLKRKESLLLDQFKVFTDEIELLRGHEKKIDSFKYNDNWYSEQQRSIENLNVTIGHCNDGVVKLNEQKNILKGKIEEKDKSIFQMIYDIKDLSNELNEVGKIRNAISNENKLISQLQDTEKNLKKMSEECDLKEEKKKEVENKIEEFSSELKVVVEKLEFAQKALDDTTGCSEAKIVEGNLNDLYAQYNAVLKHQSSEIENQKSLLETKKDLIQTYRNEISRRHIDLALYESVSYDEIQKEKFEKKLEDVNEGLNDANSVLEKAKDQYGDSKREYEAANRKLKKYGDPIPIEEIKSEFDKRRNLINVEQKSLEEEMDAVKRIMQSIDVINGRLKETLDGVIRSENTVLVELMDDLEKQFDSLKAEWKDYKKEYEKMLKQTESQLKSVIDDFEKDEYGLYKSLNNISELLNNKMGENIFSAKEMTDKYISSAQKMVLKLREDLSGIERDKKDLVHHCVLHAEQVFGGLIQLAKGSKIMVYENKPPKNMLKLDLPEKFDTDSAEKMIDIELDKEVKSFGERDFGSDFKKRKEADRIVSSGRLLRIAIQKNNLIVHAFKVDQNPDNASYRTWEDSLTYNSGAEKFIVYLSIFASILNYSKSEAAGIQNNTVYSALILDNPFGSTSSPHILLPMFSLAEHFKVQLICLTHIKQNDVVKCFDNVIKLVIKKMAMSSKEILVQEKDNDNEIETLGHGFYSVSKQLSLL